MTTMTHGLSRRSDRASTIDDQWRRAWSVRSTALGALLVFAGCSLGAAASTLLVFPGVGTAVLFPPYAVLAAALILAPVRTWWVMILAAAAGNYWPHIHAEGSTSFVLLAEVANATRAIVAAGGVRLLVRHVGNIGTLRDMAIFLTFAAVLGPVAGALIGAADVVLHNDGASFWLVWKAWLFSNVLTGLTLLPIVLTVAGQAPAWIQRGPEPRRALEAGLLLLGLVGIALFIFSGSRGLSDLPVSLYGPIPFLLWAAVRFGTGGTSAALSAITLLSIATALGGHGPFVTQTPDENLLQLQFFLITVSVPMMFLTALVRQHADTEAALRQSQAQYRSVVEDQTELICRFLADGTFTFVNHAYCRYFGRVPEELLGRSFWMFIPPEGQEAAREFLGSITLENPVASREHQIIGPDGDVRWQQWTDRGLFDTSGRLVEYQAVGRDITDRKRADEEHRMLESQRRVEEALRETDRRKDEFLAMLAHELRNPLAPIGVATEIIRSAAPPDDKVSWARDVIARQVSQLTRLVDDLLDVSRIRCGKIKLRTELVDVASVIARAVETSQPMIDSRRHQLTVGLPPGSLRVHGDSVRLAQIVSNLLHNAAKYTEPGGQVRVSACVRNAAVVISVQDDGVGIAQDMIPRIFDLFLQVETSRNRADGGLGIGLTLARQLAELHGGSVEARSEGRGKGSEFIVSLPLAIDTSLEPDADSLSRSGSDPSGAGPRRILVVDDNIDAAESLSRLLTMWKHVVHVAHDGLAAINAAAAFEPDILLLDIGMPNLDGLEVARWVRQQTRVLRRQPLLVAVTGFGQELDRRKSASAGFDHHLVKPVDPETLRALLATAFTPVRAAD